MEGGPQRHIGACEVRCVVVSRGAGVWAMEVGVSRPGDAAFRQRWSWPRFVTFADVGVARRHAELVLSGIMSVDPATGEPRYGSLCKMRRSRSGVDPLAAEYRDADCPTKCCSGRLCERPRCLE
ncbi:hypothetical protein, partial [Achromobacter ruhlandii]|uniref:hypothetical protein n=1 Tax=Achromobacter ruhlandii TaxID=72557 RepID=UPI0020160B80